VSNFSRGIAFILEGQTEEEFYISMLKYFVSQCHGYELLKEIDTDTNEYQYIITNNSNSVIVKTYTVGTIISSVRTSAIWYKNNCYKKYKRINWAVFLCYDTESYSYDISRFNSDDWKDFKETIAGNRRTNIIDMASIADIEDTMLLDIDGVCKYLGIPSCAIPSGSQGKIKMKKLFRDNKQTYHEGERARYLIDSLNKETIISKSSIPFQRIKEAFFK